MTLAKKGHDGFSVVEVLIIVLVLGVLGYIGWLVYSQFNKAPVPTAQESTSQPQPDTTNAPSWMLTGDGYQIGMGSEAAPACPEKIVSKFPVDVTKVTGVLYPGQTRGGNYKPHGGMRFDTVTDNKVTVIAPFDGTVMNGAAYLADTPGKDVQYTFDIMNDCGTMYRMGHFYTLSPELADIAKAFPAPVAGDSRTTQVKPVKIKAGTVLATVVGTVSDHNTFFDWGVYNWNTPNAISTDANWAANSLHQNSLAKHAICWFDQLSNADEKAIRALPPGDPTSGKNSDYCK